MKLLVLFSLLVVCRTSSLTEPHGKYCGSVYGNTFVMDVNKNVQNINVSAYILGNTFTCPTEPYTYNVKDFTINLPDDPDDCINTHLEEYSACPCPPKLVYDNPHNQIVMQDTVIGSIVMESC